MNDLCLRTGTVISMHIISDNLLRMSLNTKYATVHLCLTLKCDQCNRINTHGSNGLATHFTSRCSGVDLKAIAVEIYALLSAVCALVIMSAGCNKVIRLINEWHLYTCLQWTGGPKGKGGGDNLMLTFKP